MTRLQRVMLLIRDMEHCLKFYGEQGLGLHVRFASDTYAELEFRNGLDKPAQQDVSTGRKTMSASLALKVVDREAEAVSGYSPILQFVVDDFDTTVQRLLQLGGRLDGPILYPISGKVASIRSPEGQTIGLVEATEEDKD